MLKPWKKLGDEPFQWGFRKMLKRTFKMPNGKSVDFNLVDGGKVVCVLPLTPTNHVILAKQYRPAQDRFLLELPGGAMESGEMPEQAIARELLEETGYQGELAFVGESLQSAYDTLIRYNFVALNCKKMKDPVQSDHEQTEVVQMSLNDFKKHLRSGQLTDIATGYLGLDYLKML